MFPGLTYYKSSGPLPFLRGVLYLALFCSTLVSSSCDSSSSTSNGQATPMTTPLPTIVTMPEGTSYKQAASGATGVITWIEAAAAGSGWTDSKSAQDAAQQAIVANATSLQAIDYAGLSLPAFVTTTRTLDLRPDQIDGRDLRVESYGSDQNGGKWAVYGWQGPEIPQLIDRPLVHRWVQVYVLVNLSNNQVSTLFPTIVGQVYE